MDLLKKADFSKETDLKERLFRQLFSEHILAFPNREQLTDDETEMVFAAGAPGEQQPKADRVQEIPVRNKN